VRVGKVFQTVRGRLVWNPTPFIGKMAEIGGITSLIKSVGKAEKVQALHKKEENQRAEKEEAEEVAAKTKKEQEALALIATTATVDE
jgi:hypothetical protein